MKKFRMLLILAVVLFGATATLYASSPAFTVYGDGMVLQRSSQTSISGIGKAGRTVKISLAKDGKVISKSTTKADKAGRFQTFLPLNEYGTGYTLSVGDSVYTDVSVGEVWLLSGQSNMSWELGNSNENSLIVDDPNLRILLTSPTFVELRDSMTAEQLADLNELRYARNNGWQVSVKGDAQRRFSGIGLFFARRMREVLGENVPIGLVQTSFGGAPIEGFLPREAMLADTLLAKATENWMECTELNEWCRSLGVANLKGAKEPAQRHYFQPSFLFDARIAPLKGFTFKGVLWYQGESNAENIPFHNHAFTALVNSWRTHFENPELPFHFVQLSSHNRDSWSEFRNSQRLLAQQLENCEMVISHDHGNPTDVHPRGKRPVGERLANVVLHQQYGIKKLQPFSPEPISLEGNKITFNNCPDGLQTSDNQEIRGFEISMDGKTFAKVAATTQGNTVTLLCTTPAAVRYAWQPSTDANLVNTQALPISTFIITK